MIKGSYHFYGWEPFMVSHHPTKFGGRRHSDSGDAMFLVVGKQDFP